MSAPRVLSVSLAALLGALGCLEAPPGPPVSPIDAFPGATCDELFGGARSYVLCDQDDATCTFFVNLDGDFTCEIVCEQFGVACVDGFEDSDTEDKCMIEAPAGCHTSHADQICACARPGG